VALSSDGKLVLTGSFDQTAILWEAASGKKIHTFQGHTDQIIGVALSGDGKLALTGSKDKTAILWDAASGKKLHTFLGHTSVVWGVALSADGKHVLTGSFDKTAILWAVNAAPSIFPPRTVWSLDFAGNGIVNLPDLALKVDEPLTAEAWVTPRVQTSDKNHVFRVGWIHKYINRETRKWQITLQQSPSPKHKDPYRVFWSDQQFSPGKRTHVAAVWSGKEITFYVNGQLQSGHDQVLIGKAFWTSFDLGDMFQGQIHQFRVSKAQRYQGQTVSISEHFENEGKTLILYRFDEGQGDKLTDLSGNGHHGKIVGAKWVKADGMPGPWHSLFNGKDLTGWNIWNPNKDGKADYVSEDGLPAVRITPTFGLETPSYGDYHLRFEVKADEKSKGPSISALHAGGNILVFPLWPLMRRNNPNLSLFGDGSSFQKAVLRDGRIVAVGESLKGLGLASPTVVFSNLAVEPASPWVRLEIIRLGDSFVYVVNGKVAGAVTNVRDIRKGKEEFFRPAPIAFGTASGPLFLRKVEIRDISVPPPELFASVPFPPLDPAWLKAVAAMKAEQQVEAVKAELMKRNPGFDGKVTPLIDKNGVVTRLTFNTDNVADISPVRALPGLRALTCMGGPSATGKLADLSPLAGMELTELHCQLNKKVRDLSPLKGMKLTQVNLWWAQISDLTALTGMPLTYVNCANSPVSDLAPLKDMKLKSMVCFATGVKDLSPLKGMPLELLEAHFTGVTDLSPLKEMPLKTLRFNIDLKRDGEILRSIKTLKTINLKDAKEVLNGASTSALPPLDPVWLKAVAAMKAEQQVEAVKAELMKRNPGFDGKVTPAISKDGVVTELSFLTDNVTDISPVRAFVGLQTLICGGTPYQRKGQLADLSPLKGMKLTRLSCYDTKISDLSPLKDMKLTYLNFGSTAVSDLSSLKDMKLTELACDWAKVSDLSPLKGMKLTYLECRGTQVTDLSPLKGMPLKEIKLDYKADRDGPILRSIPTLEKINDKDAKEFLKAASAKALPPLDPAWIKLVAATRAELARRPTRTREASCDD
jgi:hypothetical protein